MIDTSRLTEVDRIRLQYYKNRMAGGIELTAAEALDLAIQAEDHATACGPFDPAFNHFSLQARLFTELAVILERAEHVH